jgi:hypothetical protein
MANRYTTEMVLVKKLLESVPPNIKGTLPYKEWEANSSEFKTLLKSHPAASIKAFLNKTYRASIIEVNPAPAQKLNHAYNYCPGCGFKLN